MKSTYLASQFEHHLNQVRKQMHKNTHREPPHLATDIPATIPEFYAELEYPFTDSKTNQPIKTLAPYQLRTIENHLKYQKLLVLKSQKIGLSSLGIVMTLFHALTDCQGYEIVVLAQNKDKAIQHGRDMRKFLLGSAKYRNYLIQKSYPEMGLLRDEVTKMTEIYIHNRSNFRNPTQIHILSPSVGALASLKRVKFAWCSDITLVKDVAERQQLYFLALMSRLILTEGPVFIECPTVGHLGPIYQIDDNYQQKIKAGITPGKYDFHVDRIPVMEAVKAGLMSEEAVEALRQEHGNMFGALFEANWFAGDNVWYQKDQMVIDSQANYYVEDGEDDQRPSSS